MRAVRRLAALILLAVLGGCAAAPPNAWTELSLPGPGTRLLRDGVACGGQWYVVGGRAAPDGGTSPAAWASTDGRSWRSVTLAALPGSYYGPRSVLYAVACAGGRIAAIGSRSGGAHGNPRVSTWHQRPDGSLAEAAAPFETYGGDTAVDVGRMAGGPSGFLIAGNRTGGAAAWLSPDGTAFRLFENAPGLARAFARDGAVLDGQFWLVGGLGDAPAAWSSADGASWRRAALPDEEGYQELQRVVRLGAALVAVGPRGDTFGAWRGPGWTAVGRFGRPDATGIRSLTVSDGRLYAATAGRLWRSADAGRSWLTVTTPRRARPLSAVAGRDDRVLLIAGDRAWLARGV
ncbi:hypothetical protein GCM10020358_78730 [Amorphoplanes nipponensis]|uniref:Galactose oxidase n=1 Tax=Actinoplanes nipponensis TaxID=135950 RepID=A0A919JP84_9ACTN|nr:hypothetical protein [Actinoplanes nipponensis]GIE52816.1 hypothetical protein Ani05nite_63500 [Actinoplanes nipponensis]